MAWPQAVSGFNPVLASRPKCANILHKKLEFIVIIQDTDLVSYWFSMLFVYKAMLKTW